MSIDDSGVLYLSDLSLLKSASYESLNVYSYNQFIYLLIYKRTKTIISKFILHSLRLKGDVAQKNTVNKNVTVVCNLV